MIHISVKESRFRMHLLTQNMSKRKKIYSAHSSSTRTKIGTIQKRLTWPLSKGDMQIREEFHAFNKKVEKKRKNVKHSNLKRLKLRDG